MSCNPPGGSSTAYAISVNLYILDVKVYITTQPRDFVPSPLSQTQQEM
jgi:hypothetical protein